MKRLGFILLIFIVSSNVFAIWNGREANRSQYQNVYRLSFSYKSRTGFFSFLSRTITSPNCTATAIGNYTILTAAHCAEMIRSYQKVSVGLDEYNFKMEKVFIPRGYFPLAKKYADLDKQRNTIKTQIRRYIDPPEELKSQLSAVLSKLIPVHLDLANHDMAIIRTSEPISRYIHRTKVRLSPVKVGDRVEVVGYGCTQKNSQGFYLNTPLRPHYRYAALTAIIDGYLEVAASSSADFITTPGDSGGPLILSQTGEQIGVLRGAASNKENINASQFLYLNKMRSFLKKYLK